MKGIVDIDALEDVTTRGMYAGWMELEQEPGTVQADPGRSWRDVWARVASGLVRGEAFNTMKMTLRKLLIGTKLMVGPGIIPGKKVK